MKPQYQTRYELLHESYQKWLTGFTRHAVSWGVCHPNIYYFHNLTPGWVSFNGEKPEIAIVPQSLHRLIYGPDKRTTPPLDDDLIVNLCTSEHLLVHHPMLEGIRKRAARTVLTGMCYSVGSATRQGSSSPTRFIGQSAMTSRT